MPETTALIDGLACQLGDVLGTMLGLPVRTMPAVGDTSVHWQAAIKVGGDATGTIFVGLGEDAATRLVASILGDASLVGDADIVDTLRELLGQAATAVTHGDRRRLSLDVEVPAVAPTTDVAGARQYDLMIGTHAPIRVVGWGCTTNVVRDAGRTATATAPPLPTAAPAITPPRNLDVVLDIELPITVRFGATQMTLESLARLGPGSVIDLDRAPDDPVELLVNGRLVARGQVVVVSGCYGVRVNEVVSPADRLRSLEL